MARIAFTAALLLVLFLAKVAINDLAVANGLLDYIGQQQQPIRFTSLAPVDDLLTTLVRFFQPVVAADDEALTLFSVFMAGQLLATHLLVVVEGLRAGNRGKLVSFTTFWGTLWQIITYGITLPIYFILWTWTSSIAAAAAAAKSSPETYAAAISIDPHQGRAVTPATTLGALLPTLFVAALSAPRILSLRAQEVALAVWQASPVLTGLAQTILARLFAFVKTKSNNDGGGDDDDDDGDDGDGPKAREERFRQIYAHGLAIAAVSHLGALGYAYWSAGGGLPAMRLLGDMFLPTKPWDARPMDSVAKGVLILLQWDCYCASLATWTWIAYGVWCEGAAGAGEAAGRVIAELARAVAWSLVVGPAGAALVFVWGRDVGVTRAAAGKKKKMG